MNILLPVSSIFRIQIHRHCLFLYFLGCFALSLNATEYFVSPSGRDTNNNLGDYEHPFLTIQKARDVVRGLNSDMKNDIFINLLEGTYSLTDPLTFNESDSGNNGHNIIYRGYHDKRPIISGGRAITGWFLYDKEKNIWRAYVGKDLQTRQVYVNGFRAARAHSSGGLPGNIIITPTGYTITDTTMKNWSNPSDNSIEFVYIGDAGMPRSSTSVGRAWAESRIGVESISESGNVTTFVMKEPAWSNGRDPKKCPIDKPQRIENSYELLTQPGDHAGEWYLNHSAGYLYYIPRPEETMDTAKVVAPQIQTLVNLTGCHNIQFKGITFAYATWMTPNSGQGFIDGQATFGAGGKVPGNVTLTAARSILFERNIFVHLGAAGVDLNSGCQNNSFVGNVFTDISGSAIQIGTVLEGEALPSNLQLSGNQITDNYIHDLPTEYHGGVGILGGYVDHTVISHNEIANCSYSGMSVGWSDKSHPATYWVKDYVKSKNSMCDNHIEYNYIHHTMQLLKDGGGIYTRGVQPGTTIAYNYVTDAPKAKNTPGGIYPDEGSSCFDISHNVVTSVYIWLLIGWSSDCNLSIHDNYTDNTNTIPWKGFKWTAANPEPTNSPIDYPPNYVISDPALSDPAKEIIAGAGIEAAYRDIKNITPINFDH